MNKHIWRIGIAMFAFAIICIGWAAVLLPQRPDMMAMQFSGSGDAADVKSKWFTFATMAALQILPIAVFGLTAGSGFSSNLEAKANAGFWVSMQVLVGMLSVELFRANLLSPARFPASYLVWAAIITILAGVLTGVVYQPVTEESAQLTVPTHVVVAENISAAWLGKARLAAPVIALVTAITVGLIAIAILTRDALTAIVSVVVLMLSMAVLTIRVCINRRGLTYSSALGLLRRTIALEDIDSVDIVDIRVGDWGGRACVASAILVTCLPAVVQGFG